MPKRHTLQKQNEKNPGTFYDYVFRQRVHNALNRNVPEQALEPKQVEPINLLDYDNQGNWIIFDEFDMRFEFPQEKIEMPKLLVGADPELFVKRGRFHVSAHGMIPGTKVEPHKVEDGAVQVDGLALEFNIDPADSADKFVANINSVMRQLKAMIPADHEFNVVPSVMFGDKLMSKQPEEALLLGCEADYNAYTQDVNPAPHPHKRMRTAAGHVHIGWTKNQDPLDPAHFLGCVQAVRMLDIYLGLASVFFDKDTRRARMYGKPGAFRPKPYGVEYRSLSNFWLKHDALKEMVYLISTKAIHDLVRRGGVPGMENWNGYLFLNGRKSIYVKDVQRAMITKNEALARVVMKQYGLTRYIDTALQKMREK